MSKKSSIAEALRIAIENNDTDSIQAISLLISETEEMEKEYDEMSARIDKELKSVGERPKGKPFV